MQTRTRLVIVWGGLPRPEAQWNISRRREASSRVPISPIPVARSRSSTTAYGDPDRVLREVVVALRNRSLAG